MEVSNCKLIVDHLPGAVVIDMNGIIVYINEQCAKYLGVVREKALGDYVKNVFPDTKMMEGLRLDKPEIVFYNSFGIGISVHVPLFIDGKKVGLLEYDVVQASEMLYELADNYTKFLDQELNFLKSEIDELRSTKYSINNIIGESELILNMKETITCAAKTNSTVVIYGETGTGKELVAHSVHGLSRRKKNNFVKVNAASIPENLVESELFGYEGGSFTGAIKKGKKGKFEMANNGTLFIDEINQMPLSIQPKLLRVLQENEIERIGGDGSIPVDVRIIVTTNQDLRKLVKEGKFREDLFYRLHVVLIKIPPLRDRKEDIPLLANYFIQNYSNIMGKNITHVDEGLYEIFKQYDWPGNIRELQNVIERGINFTDGDCLTLEHVKINGRAAFSEEKCNASENPIENAKKEAEKKIILMALEMYDGNKTRAAEYLKISRPLLYQKLTRLGIK